MFDYDSKNDLIFLFYFKIDSHEKQLIFYVDIKVTKVMVVVVMVVC